jgi:hypothetical protein
VGVPHTPPSMSDEEIDALADGLYDVLAAKLIEREFDD